MAHHPAWVSHHTGGSRTRGCGLLTNSATHNNESKKTQHDNNMVAEQDGRRQQGLDSEMQVERNIAECQNSDNCVGNRCESHGVCRVKATSTVIHLNEYTCQCDSCFELKSTARVAVYQLPSTMLGMCSRTSLSLRKLPSTSVQCLQSQSRNF